MVGAGEEMMGRWFSAGEEREVKGAGKGNPRRRERGGDRGKRGWWRGKRESCRCAGESETERERTQGG